MILGQKATNREQRRQVVMMSWSHDAMNHYSLLTSLNHLYPTIKMLREKRHSSVNGPAEILNKSAKTRWCDLWHVQPFSPSAVQKKSWRSNKFEMGEIPPPVWIKKPQGASWNTSHIYGMASTVRPSHEPPAPPAATWLGVAQDPIRHSLIPSAQLNQTESSVKQRDARH